MMMTADRPLSMVKREERHRCCRRRRQGDTIIWMGEVCEYDNVDEEELLP